MTTALKLRPSDHGRTMSFQEFVYGDREPGYKYELINGRVHVSPLPDPPANVLEEWLLDQLKGYARARPDIANYVTNKARIYVGGRDDVSYPEPDIAVYHRFPLERRFHLRWREVNPLLVVEVMDPDDPDKDLVRNVEVYLAVSSIREYWILDTRQSMEHPSLLVHRRQRQRWRISEVAPGGIYRTRLLPGFELVVDPNVKQAEE
jgi:Uma2 family endonuclease